MNSGRYVGGLFDPPPVATCIEKRKKERDENLYYWLATVSRPFFPSV